MIKDITYMHEHVTIDLSKEKNNIDCKLDTFDITKEEFLRLKELGVTRVVDVSNVGIGRDVDYVMRMEEATGIEIYMSTGYYKEPFLPKEVEELTVEELAKKMIDDIKIGIDRKSKCATLIGEIGTGFEIMTELEKKVFHGAAIAQKATGVFITTHTSLGKLGHEQLDFLENLGVDLNKVILGHVALSNDLDYIRSLLKRGAYIEFDTIGKNSYLPDETRVDFIKILCEEGWSEKLLMSVDLTRRSHLKINGGIGYAYLIETFVPMLREAAIKESDLEKILVKNPKRILGVE
ncbi:MAG: phosphotriesterase family protein [Paraclostridium sp.]|uniref:phosphotriesterase family protein n=1 Tax=Paraclostridium sp. TaxID=2023273 RepID=UPI003F2A423B